LSIAVTSIWWLTLATICFCVCWRDLKSRIVTNTSVIFLGCVLLTSKIVHGSELYFVNSLLLLLLGMLLWKLGLFGAGDVKLASAFALSIDPEYLLLFLVIMLILGGIEALLYLLIKKLKPTRIVHDGLPFAIPIVLSGVFSVGASI